MKNIIYILFLSLSILPVVNAQTFDVDTIIYSGNEDKRINFVFLGDGYTATTQNDFIADVSNFSNYLFSIAPFSNYKNFFNVYAIKVVSNELGVTHPNTALDCSSASPLVPASDQDTYFKCSFDVGGVHRCIYVTNPSTVYDVLFANFPNYDQIVVLSNNPYYGGCGGAFAVSTTDNSAKETVAHELGHSFGHLADEYGITGSGERANVTQETDPFLIKWKNWLGDNGIGIYQIDTSTWYRPHQNCKMRYLYKPFCSVCTEALIERIHDMISAIDNYSPTNLNVSNPAPLLDFKLALIKPNPNTLRVNWKLDGSSIANNIDSVQIVQSLLSSGAHTLTATVVDTTELLRINNHSSIHYNTVTWNITKTTVGIDVYSNKNQFSVAVYPNPASEKIVVSLNTKNESRVSFLIINTQGKTVKQFESEKNIEGDFEQSFSIQDLPKGTYFLNIFVGATLHTETFIKD